MILTYSFGFNLFFSNFVLDLLFGCYCEVVIFILKANTNTEEVMVEENFTQELKATVPNFVNKYNNPLAHFRKSALLEVHLKAKYAISEHFI